MPINIPDQTIAAQIKVPDAMSSLASIMQVRNQQQQLQNNQLSFSVSDQANAKTIALRDLAASPGMSKPDGSFDNAKFAGRAPQIDPEQGLALGGKSLSNQGAGIQNKDNQFQLDSKMQDYAQQHLAGLVQNPAVIAAADPAQMADPENAAKIRIGIQDALGRTASGLIAGGLPASFVHEKMGVLGQIAQQNPGALHQQFTDIINQRLNGSGQAAQNLVPASQQQTPSTDTAGNPAIQAKDKFGQVQPLKAQQIAGQLTAPMPSGPFAPGEKDRIAPLALEVMAAKNAALSAPLLHMTNKGILHEIDNVSATGISGPTFQKINSYLGGVLDFSTAEKKASSYDMVGKYLEKNALTAAASMGPQTNAGLEAQVKANGSVGYNPSAIKAITKLNDALVSGSEAYAPGLKKAMDANPTRGVLAKEQYDEQWSKVFKPEVMQLYNAAKSDDSAEKDRLIKAAGGADSLGVKDMVMRAQGIQSLMKTGQLPPNFGLK